MSPLVRRARDERKAQGLTVVQVAAKSGIHKMTVHGWFSGRKAPGLLNFEAVLNAMGLELVIRRRDGA